MQALRWASPSIVTRHSKQMPIAQSGPRISPCVELLNPQTPALISAAATLLPRSVSMRRPLIRIAIFGIQLELSNDAHGIERTWIESRLPTDDQIGQ
jgi:hypothetical protein